MADQGEIYQRDDQALILWPSHKYFHLREKNSFPDSKLPEILQQGT